MIKAIFSEHSEEYGLPVTLGLKEFNTDNIQEAHDKAKSYANVLEEVRGKSVEYMLENKNGIVVTIA
jgi:hypothetical protein